MGMRVTCYYDDCIHLEQSHCFNKGGNLTIGGHMKRKGNKKASCCWDYEEPK